MQDGRFITNYTGNRIYEQHIRIINKLDSIYDYKHFLQNNADELMKKQRQFANRNNTCSINCLIPLSKLS
jgi:hypothetical protein